MSRIRSKDTQPELAVRKALHRLGFRFRLHRSDLPGKPDIVLPKWKSVILVHGCFWHGHRGCEEHTPSSNIDYWAPKLARNKERDRQNLKNLRALGWKCLVIWECEAAKDQKLEMLLSRFLPR